MKSIFYTLLFMLTFTVSAQYRTISIDVQNVKGSLNKTFNECIGAGRANEGLRADWQQQLKMTKEDCGFRYIRMHGLLTDDMGVYKVNREGEPMYNFQYIDVLFDYLLSIDIKPFVELGFMPEGMASGERTIFWWKGNVTPPSDYDRWGELIENLARHFEERYGEEEVKSWYFEVWNEPNLTPWFWDGSMEEYFKLYEYAARAVKRVNSAYKVGGPATAGAAWEPEMIQFCEENDVPLDFISTHSYGVKEGFLDEYGGHGTVLNPEPMAVSSDIIQSRKEISESTKPDLELHITEWSASYTPADPIHDSYHEAAYILQKLKQIGPAAQSMSYWVFTDIFEEPGPRFEAFHGGFGLMNTQGIKKSAYHAYSFLNVLGDTELSNSDSMSWVTKNDRGDFQLLLWDFTYTLPDSTNNQDYYSTDLPAKAKGTVKLEVKGLEKGEYTLSIYQTGYNTNDPYTAYIKMGSPAQLTRQQVEILKRASTGRAIKSEPVKVNKNGKFQREIEMRENDVFLLTLNKKN
ncbi:GH39 family glycosyl hydrolase [Marinoscillum sp.]|uniref:GH39 family glycosyl hydrolase n=1 Tax=Marinoscillum sp. TaxID=2024838 RepID=UPI003BAC1B30